MSPELLRLFDPFVFVLVLAGFLVGMKGERWRATWGRGVWRMRRASPPRPKVLPFERVTPKPVTDAAEQLRVVIHASFDKRNILNKAEMRVFRAAEQAIEEAKLSWRVLAQVSLGEVLRTPCQRAYSTINSKRVDLLIVSEVGEPLAAIEYQGQGHYQGSAPARDAVKREALRKAGVRFIEMTPEHGPDDLRRELFMVRVHELNAIG